MNISHESIRILISFMEQHGESTVSEMKEYAEQTLKTTINTSTFYTIINHMKSKGYIKPTGDRGCYAWVSSAQNADASMDQEPCSSSAESDGPSPSAPESASAASNVICAEEFVRRGVDCLRIKNTYQAFTSALPSLYPWGITPELAACIHSLEIIVREFEKIDNILAKLEKDER